MADLAERKDTKDVEAQLYAGQVASVVPAVPAEGPSHPGENDAARPALKAGTPRSAETLLDPKQVEALRAINTKNNLESNFWFETAGLLRWGTIGMLATALGGLFTQLLGAPAGAAAVGAATVMSGGCIAALIAGACVLGALTIYASQKSREIFVERNFDVQDFQMQRQAALMGKSVEHSLGSDSPAKLGEAAKWSDKFASKAPTDSWAQGLKAETVPAAEMHAR